MFDFCLNFFAIIQLII